jgi:EAL domain-containing protein (putative c-di-GMP-specific phosphodiesterase class I)
LYSPTEREGNHGAAPWLLPLYPSPDDIQSGPCASWMGKSLQPLNAMAVRPPINTPAAAAPAATEAVTAESLGWQLRAALPPLRLHSVSLYDDQANVLWLSEGALGPDEHGLVLDSMEVLSNDRSLPAYENGLEDGRVAIFLPVRAPQGELAGVAMILADLKSVSDGVMEKIVSPQVRTIMVKIAMLLRANVSRNNPEPPAPVPVAIAPVLELTPPAPARAAPAARASVSAPAPAPAPPAKPAAAAKPAASNNTKANASKPVPAAPARSAVPTVAPAVPVAQPAPAPEQEHSLSPQAIDDILEFELFPDVRVASVSTEEEVPMSPASSFQQDSLAWTTSGLSLSSDDPAPAVVPVLEPAKPAAAPARAAAPAKPAATPAPPPAAVIPVAQVASVVTAAPALQAPVAAPTLAAAPTPSAATDPIASIRIDLSLPAALGGSNPTPTPAPAPAAAAARSTGATTTSKALGNMGTARALNGSATSEVQVLNATGTSRTIALEPSNLILDVQPFSKLRAGGRMRRYEVLPRIAHRDANRAAAATDGLALQRLLSWLGSNRSAWNLEPTSFSLNLSISTLEDERFPQQVASSLKANGIAPDNLGFEIAEPLCTQRRAQVERFISLCDKLGCFVVIDDFSFDSSVLPLLRSKALRLVKIDPKLTSAALRDKLSQAVVVAIVQAVKVLGIHCAAKRVESQASLQWLTAIGCDLAQGPALSQVLPIESLNMAQAAPPAAEPPKAG